MQPQNPPLPAPPDRAAAVARRRALRRHRQLHRRGDGEVLLDRPLQNDAGPVARRTLVFFLIGALATWAWARRETDETTALRRAAVLHHPAVDPRPLRPGHARRRRHGRDGGGDAGVLALAGAARFPTRRGPRRGVGLLDQLQAALHRLRAAGMRGDLRRAPAPRSPKRARAGAASSPSRPFRRWRRLVVGWATASARIGTALGRARAFPTDRGVLHSIPHAVPAPRSSAASPR